VTLASFGKVPHLAYANVTRVRTAQVVA
jgi:hypothetical protein